MIKRKKSDLLVKAKYINILTIILRVKDFAGSCDCIKDLNDSQLIKKTQIVSMSTLTLLSLVNTLLSSKF